MDFNTDITVARVTAQNIDVICCAKLVSQTVNAHKVHFFFGDSWDGYIKKAIFRTKTVEREQVLADDKCAIPWECLEQAGEYLYIGVYGVQGDKVRPTVWSKGLYIHQGAHPTEEAQPPTPDIYQQFVNQIESGMLTGPQGETGPQVSKL